MGKTLLTSARCIPGVMLTAGWMGGVLTGVFLIKNSGRCGAAICGHSENLLLQPAKSQQPKGIS